MRTAETKCAVKCCAGTCGVRCTASKVALVCGTCKGRRPRRQRSPAACTRPHERRPRECVRQSGAGRAETLRGVRGHARDPHACVPALPAARQQGGRRVVHWRHDRRRATDSGGHAAVGTRQRHGRWATAAAPLWRRRSRVMSCALRHTPSGKRHASCGGWARAYGQEADRRPGRRWRPAERERRRRQRRRRQAHSPHEMTAPRRRVATSSLVQQPGSGLSSGSKPAPAPAGAGAGLRGGTSPAPAQIQKSKDSLFPKRNLGRPELHREDLGLKGLVRRFFDYY
jgi:hypothetical protein